MILKGHDLAANCTAVTSAGTNLQFLCTADAGRVAMIIIDSTDPDYAAAKAWAIGNGKLPKE